MPITQNNFQFDNEKELKHAFAEALLRNPNAPMKAAEMIFPDNTGYQMRATAQWVRDPVVIAEKERLVEEYGPMHFLPAIEDVAAELYAKANEIRDPEDSHRFYKLYCEIRNFMPKKDTNINATLNNITNKVMVVTSNGTDEEWEAKLQTQQRKLVEESRG